MTMIGDIARAIASTGFHDIVREPGLVETAKLNILDTLGVTMAGNTLMPACRGMAEVVREAGGKPESTVLGFNFRVPAWSAAFLNGLLVHCLDYDDTDDAIALHPSAPVIPAALAMAERGGISGKDLITAVVLGGDLDCKLGRAVAPYYRTRALDWMITQTFGVFGAAAAAASLARLDEDHAVDALGIAFTHASGSMELLAPGSNIRGFYEHVPALAGVLSVLMVQKGITGIKDPFEGKFGLFNLYFGGEYDAAALKDFGRAFDYPQKVSLKPWASCRQAHGYIEAALDIVTGHDIKPGDIKSITVFVGEQSRRLCEPVENRRRPANELEAKFSIPWCVACACARREVTLRDFTADGIKDPVALKLAGLIEARFDEEMNVMGAVPPGKVELETAGGGKFTRSVTRLLGHPDHPLPVDQAIKKFRECASYAAEPLPETALNRLIEAVMELEKAESVNDVTRLLSG